MVSYTIVISLIRKQKLDTLCDNIYELHSSDTEKLLKNNLNRQRSINIDLNDTEYNVFNSMMFKNSKKPELSLKEERENI